MHTQAAKHLKQKLKTMFKTDKRWLENLKHEELIFLARTNPDLCETTIQVPGRGRGTETKRILKPETRNRFTLYKLLRSKRRIPRNDAAEKIIKDMEDK
jgi:hypothetical protein